jgi:ribosome-interacting GTPase 1
LHYKNKVIFDDYNYNGIKNITSEEGFNHVEDNFIKEIKNNFRIREALNIDNTLCEIITLQPVTENVVGKYQNSVVTASKISFKERQLFQRTIGFRSYPGGRENLP